MSEVHTVFAQVASPKGDHPGAVVEGAYTVDGGVVTLDDAGGRSRARRTREGLPTHVAGGRQSEGDRGPVDEGFAADVPRQECPVARLLRADQLS
jgi:hypothetical protein